jgi:hypothetical protein
MPCAQSEEVTEVPKIRLFPGAVQSSLFQAENCSFKLSLELQVTRVTATRKKPLSTQSFLLGKTDTVRRDDIPTSLARGRYFSPPVITCPRMRALVSRQRRRAEDVRRLRRPAVSNH